MTHRLLSAASSLAALCLCLALVLFSPASRAATCPVGLSTCLTGQGDWTSTLQERSFDGGVTVGGYFDSSLGITWLADTNLAGGHMTFASANAWAASLTIGGYTGWRLPTMTDTGTPGCNLSIAGGTDCGWNVATGSSELAHMFYVTLGNVSACPVGNPVCSPPQNPHGLVNTGPLASLQPTFYWTNVLDALDPNRAWYFDFNSGTQYSDSSVDSVSQYSWAVHAGDVGQAVTAVPLPASAWMLLSGLLCLALLTRGRHGALRVLR